MRRLNKGEIKHEEIRSDGLFGKQENVAYNRSFLEECDEKESVVFMFSAYDNCGGLFVRSE
jgi:hypothetical protein